MNNKGQFLLYDAIFALILVLLVTTTVMYVLENSDGKMEASLDYNRASDMLNTLEYNNLKEDALLSSLSYNLDINDTYNINKSLKSIEYILDGSAENYTFSDVTHNKSILIDKKAHLYSQAYSSKKRVGNHEYELTYYE